MTQPKKFGRNTPVTAPGPSSKKMLLNLPRIVRNPLTFLESVQRDFGDVVQFPIPKPATYMVSSPEAAREILVNSHRVTNKQTIQYTTLSLVTGDGLLTVDGSAWLPRRRMLQPAFHRELLDLVHGHIDRALARQDQQWRQLCGDGSAVIDIDRAMMSLALDITTSALFGVDLDNQTERITQATLTALHGVVARARNPLALPLAIPTLGNIRMNRAIRKLDDAVSQIIEHRRANPLAPDAPIRDMLDLLMDRDREEVLTHQEIRDEIATFIVAGHETVASALTWSWKLLTENPAYIDSVRSAEASAMTSSDVGMIAQNIFDESLRLYPPAWVITRMLTADIYIHETLLPKGALVIVSPWLVHRHDSVWSSPELFDPTRFSDGVPQLGYLPFGSGPRLCIGRDMARFEGKRILEHLIHHWNITVETQSVDVEASVTLRPRHGLLMRISPLQTGS